jgi:hypothetical protein
MLVLGDCWEKSYFEGSIFWVQAYFWRMIYFKEIPNYWKGRPNVEAQTIGGKKATCRK